MAIFKSYLHQTCMGGASCETDRPDGMDAESGLYMCWFLKG